MVASANGDFYNPFPYIPLVEGCVHSSEEDSALHSAILDESYDLCGGYHLDRSIYSNFPTQLPPPLMTAVDAHDSTDAHLRTLETLQPSFATIRHHLPPSHPPTDIPLHEYEHPMLDPGIPSSRFHPAVTNSAIEYSMPLFRPIHIQEQDPPSEDSAQFFPSQQSTAATESKPQISLPSPADTVRSNLSNSNTSSQKRKAFTVVVACRKCRARKIRCDSTRPFCHNCVRRGNECEYDTARKGRGPDKNPGTRQRSCRKRSSDTEVTSAPAQKKSKTNADGDTPAFDVKVKKIMAGGNARGQLFF